jgi:hypothetical protein
MLFRPGFVHSANITAPFTENMAHRSPALESRADTNSEALPFWSSDQFYFCSSPDFDGNAEVAHLAPTSQSNITISSPPVMEGLVTTDLLATAVKPITTASGAYGQDDRR